VNWSRLDIASVSACAAAACLLYFGAPKVAVNVAIVSAFVLTVPRIYSALKEGWDLARAIIGL
jgi:hypothetical protein